MEIHAVCSDLVPRHYELDFIIRTKVVLRYFLFADIDVLDHHEVLALEGYDSPDMLCGRHVVHDDE